MTKKQMSGYGNTGKSFTPVMGFTDVLAAGSYSVKEDMSGNLHFIPHELKSNELIFTDNSLAQKIIGEFKQFLGLRDKYKKYGFVHKRAFLLHGPPGNGKTSVLVQLSRLMAEQYDGITIHLAMNDSPDECAAAIRQLHSLQPERPVLVLMEEVDGLYRNWSSDLLTLLDGGEDVDNVFFVATTNFLDRLDARMRDRPSRIDTLIEVGPPSAEVRAEFLRRKGVDAKTVEALVKSSEGLSFAHLKEFIIAHVILEQPLKDVTKRLKQMGSTGDDESDDDDDDYDYNDD